MWQKTEGRNFLIECFDSLKWRQKCLQIFRDLVMMAMTENPPPEHNDKRIWRAISDLLFAW